MSDNEYEQWGDKAGDLEAENNRFNYNDVPPYEDDRELDYYSSKKKSGGFFNTLFKVLAIFFIIYVIALLTK